MTKKEIMEKLKAMEIPEEKLDRIYGGAGSLFDDCGYKADEVSKFPVGTELYDLDTGYTYQIKSITGSGNTMTFNLEMCGCPEEKKTLSLNQMLDWLNSQVVIVFTR